MATFPTFEKGESRPREAVSVTPPELTGEETPEERMVKLQWRDVVDQGLDKSHPLSLNRDADEVSNDSHSA